MGVDYIHFMRFSLACLLITLPFAPRAQRFSVFETYNFDSTYYIVAMGSSFKDPGKDSKAYNFFVDNVAEMKRMKEEWTVKTMVPHIFYDQDMIDLFIMKDSQLVNTQIMIYPKQGVIRARNNWYDFDMKKFEDIEKRYPLNYHSKTFQFASDLDFALFYDSIENTPSYIFLFEPHFLFEGHFDIIAPRSPDPASPIFVLSDINKELEALTPAKNFRAQGILNDPFNEEHTDKTKIMVESSKKLYDRYKNRFNIKGAWIPSIFESKVFFRD